MFVVETSECLEIYKEAERNHADFCYSEAIISVVGNVLFSLFSIHFLKRFYN